MTAEHLILAAILAAAAFYLGWLAWRTLRGKSSCNCGCCEDKLKRVSGKQTK